ncbi:hypothetical protein AKJ16_DCAP19954, partial [Drosera capensis]
MTKTFAAPSAQCSPAAAALSFHPWQELVVDIKSATMSRLTLHSNFFSSLKQVERRLKLESSSHTTPSSSQKEPLEQVPLPQRVDTHYSWSESLGSPIHLYKDHQTNESSILQDSEPPQWFLSDRSQSLPTDKDPLLEAHQSSATELDQHEDNVDDIELLIQLLGLTDLKEKQSNEHANLEDANINLKHKHDDSEECHCRGGFYEKVVVMKGPKCEKEVKRLDRWIGYCGRTNGKQRKEPLRLAHLLLGKAAYLSREGSGSEALEFPSTVHDFLQ